MTQELVLPLPLPQPHQREVVDRGERVKVLRWGRRTGKTRVAFLMSLLGHGGGRHLGLMHRLNVCWLAPNFKQAKILWDEEVWPRFHEFGTLNEQEMTAVPARGFGTLYIRSGHTRDAIDSIRGMGAQLAGVVVDEAADLDLEYALKQVVLPTLLDRAAWLVLSSTPRAGSYFNVVCKEAMAGLRADTWHSHKVPWDNPLLDPPAIEALVREYAADSPDLRQQVYAELLEAGVGLAFKEFNLSVHVLEDEPERRAGVRWVAGIDWGYDQPGAVLLMACLPGGGDFIRSEFYHREQTPYQVGFTVGQIWQGLAIPEWVAFDPSMLQVRDGGPTIVEEWGKGLRDALGPLAPPLVPAPAGKGSRYAGKQLLHERLRYEPDRKWSIPRLRIHPSCRNLITQLATLPLDSRTGEDVDTRAEDHCYDCARYILMLREPRVGVPEHDTDPNRHPGTLTTGQRKSRNRSWETQMQERWIEGVALGQVEGGRYGPRPRAWEWV